MATTESIKLQSDHSLLKTIDSNGHKPEGVFRLPSGGLTVDNDQAYQRYLKEKERLARFDKLENEVSEIKDMLRQFLIENKK